MPIFSGWKYTLTVTELKFWPKDGFIIPLLGSTVKWGILPKLKSIGKSSFLFVITICITFFSLTLHSQKFKDVLSIVISGKSALTSIYTVIVLQKSSSTSFAVNLLTKASSNLTAAKLWKCSVLFNWSLKFFALSLLFISYSGLNVTFHPFSCFFIFVLHKNFIGICEYGFTKPETGSALNILCVISKPASSGVLEKSSVS